MILPPMPVLDDKSIQEEVRKAFVALAIQLTTEIEAIKKRLDDHGI